MSVDNPDQTRPSPAEEASPNSGPPPFVRYGGFPQAPASLPQHPLRVVEALLAFGVLATAVLPWFTLRYSTIAFSASLADVPDLSTSPPPWLYLLGLGFMIGLAAALVSVARRQSRAAAIAEMAGFGLTLIGILLALSGGMTSSWWVGGMSGISGFRVEAGVGLWICLALAVAGLTLASIHAIRPDFMQPAARSAPPYLGPSGAFSYQPVAWPATAWPAAPPPAWPATAWPAAPPPPSTAPPAPWPAVSPATGPPAPAVPAVLPAVPTALSIPAVSPDSAGSSGVGASSEHGAPGQIVTLESGRSTTFVIAPGQRVLIGRGPGADLVIYDARVSPIHALIERRGPGWLVTGLDASNPTWILDPTGRPHPVSSELGLRSGTLLVGGCQVLLYAPGTSM